MNRNETERLWRSLLACTCTAGSKAPYDCVGVNDGVMYATNSYVLHKVEGALQGQSHMRSLHVRECAYFNRVATLEEILRYDPDARDMSNLCKGFDPSLLTLAMRPHAALSASVSLYSGCARKNAALILRSVTPTPSDPIIITTAVMGKRC